MSRRRPEQDLKGLFKKCIAEMLAENPNLMTGGSSGSSSPSSALTRNSSSLSFDDYLNESNSSHASGSNSPGNSISSRNSPASRQERLDSRLIRFLPYDNKGNI